MGRAARLKRERKGTPPALMSGEQRIKLQNPVQDFFASFCLGNATMWERLAIAELERVAPGKLAALETEFREQPRVDLMLAFRKAIVDAGGDLLVVQKDSAKGQHLVLCGAGPSLKDEIATYAPQADQLWGCNSALTYLISAGYQPTHGFTVDQTPEMLHEWASVPDVEYLVSTTVHPHLTELLAGRGRRIRYFNNYVGMQGRRPVDCGNGEIMEYEDWLYSVFFPSTVRTGSGLNSVNRAIDLALFMGFDRISVLGADCAMRFTSPPKGDTGSPEQLKWLEEEVVMHADGGHALVQGATALTMFGSFCTEPTCAAKRCKVHPLREWLTKPDMIISAAWLEKTRQFNYPYSKPYHELTEAERLAERIAMDASGEHGRVQLVGDTLPAALKDKRDKFLRRLPNMTDGNGKPLPWL